LASSLIIHKSDEIHIHEHHSVKQTVDCDLHH
jgi:hypothetical protein